MELKNSYESCQHSLIRLLHLASEYAVYSLQRLFRSRYIHSFVVYRRLGFSIFMSDREEEGSDMEGSDEESDEEAEEETNSRESSFVLLDPPPVKRLSPISIIRGIMSDLEAMESALTERYTTQASARTLAGDETPLNSDRRLLTSRTAVLLDAPIALARRVSSTSSSSTSSRRVLTNS